MATITKEEFEKRYGKSTLTGGVLKAGQTISIDDFNKRYNQQPYQSQLIGEEGYFRPTSNVRIRDVARESANLLGSTYATVGQPIGEALALKTKDYIGAESSQEDLAKMRFQLESRINEKRRLGEDTSHLEDIMNKTVPIGNLPEEIAPSATKITKGQALAGAGQIGLDAITFGTYSGLAKTLQLATKSPKIAAIFKVPLQKVVEPTMKSLGQQIMSYTGQTAKMGLIGYGFETTGEMVGGKSLKESVTPGVGTVVGLGIGGLVGLPSIIGRTAGLERALSKEAKIPGLEKGAIEKYRQAMPPSKAMLKNIEIEAEKDINDSYKIFAEEKVLPKKDVNGRFDTADESLRLQTVKSELDEAIAKSTDDIVKKNNLLELKKEAYDRIDASPDLESIRLLKKKNVDELIDPEITKRGEMVTDRELHDLKNRLYTIGYDMNNQTKSPTARLLARTAKSTIERNTSDVQIKGMNNLSGQYAEAITVLNGLHGSTARASILGSRMTAWMYSWILDGVLGRVPLIGTFIRPIGYFIGRHWEDFMRDPERIILKALKDVKKAKLEPRVKNAIEVAEKQVQKRIDDMQSRLQLPAPAIRMGGKSDIVLASEQATRRAENDFAQRQLQLRNTLALPEPESRTIVPNREGTPNLGGFFGGQLSGGAEQIGGMRQRITEPVNQQLSGRETIIAPNSQIKPQITPKTGEMAKSNNQNKKPIESDYSTEIRRLIVDIDEQIRKYENEKSNLFEKERNALIHRRHGLEDSLDIIGKQGRNPQ